MGNSASTSFITHTPKRLSWGRQKEDTVKLEDVLTQYEEDIWRVKGKQHLSVKNVQLTRSIRYIDLAAQEITQTEASSWTVEVPSSVKGLPGSCVVIPCSYNYRNPGKPITEFTGIWTDGTNQVVYHPVESKVMQQYRGRMELLGDVSQKNCSLKIDPLQTSEPNPISFSMKEEVLESQPVSASCSVSHSCPTSPPVFIWSHPGEAQLQLQQFQVGQWKSTSTLTFHPTSADDNKDLTCTIKYKGGMHHSKSKGLRVKYAPVNVNVEYKSEVKEGEDVRLKCSSDAHPPASSYEWHNAAGAQLYQGKIFMLPNVSRHHTGDLYCTAINTIGRSKSHPVQLNVLYAPEVKTESSCSSEVDMVKCVCIADSRPPSTIHFVLSNRVLQSTKAEKHSTVTIGTLKAELGSYEYVICLANNTQGSANLTLFLPVNSKLQSLYIIISIGAGMIFLMPLIAVGIVKKWGRSGDAPTPDMSTMKANKDVELPQYAATKRKVQDYDDVHCPGIYPNESVYGNMENDWDDAIYANI
ncbi:B-cell receptor CD22-like [Symphorus nematophorus]